MYPDYMYTFQSRPSSSNYQGEPSPKKIKANQDREKTNEEITEINTNFSGNSIDALLNQALAGRERILGQSSQRLG